MAVPVAICDLRQSQSQALHRPSHTRQGWGQFNSGIGIAAQFQFLFRNWNPIPIPELELELKLVELKMELELKPLELELELKTGIEFLATATTALTS